MFFDKRILIIGGGPSTLSFDFSLVQQYDHVWSMNHFFRNPELKNIKLSLIALSPENNLSDQGLNSYIQKFNPLVGFEPRARWRIPIEISTAKQFSKDKKCFSFMTYYGGKNGVGSRLINLASEFGAKEVSFIGLDGIPKIFDKVHAFEKGKATLLLTLTKETLMKS